MPASTPTVCVIGAGISGLTSTKMLLDYAVEVDCFEASDRIGGNWAFGNPNGLSSAYRSLHIDTSKERLSFKDFPIPAEYPDFPHHTQIKAYLDSYAEAFDLHQAITFNTKVTSAVRGEQGGWTVTTEDGAVRGYDVLVVGNGHHWDPRLPDFPGEFSGRAIHSHHYKSPIEPFECRDQRILVVGIGNSAVDIACELSQASLGNRVTLSTRSGAWVVPKYLFGIPVDKVARTSPHIPLRWQRMLLRPIPRLVQGKPEKYGLPRPDHHFLEAHPTMSGELLIRLGSGDLTAKPNIERLDGQTVHFADGSSDDFDIVIYATGYNITFPFLSQELVSAPDNNLPLFKRMLDPRYDDLVFVGFAQGIPTLFPLVEVQSRLLGAYVTERYRPPPPDEMRRVIAEDHHRFVGHYNPRPRHTQQVDYFIYDHDIMRRELPAGARRVAELGPVQLAGRAPLGRDRVERAPMSPLRRDPGVAASSTDFVQIADDAPGALRALNAAAKARAIVRHYPCGPEGLRPGGEFHDLAARRHKAFQAQSRQ